MGMDATGSLACITGATDGIGLHTAINLASRGYDLVIHGRYVWYHFRHYMKHTMSWPCHTRHYLYCAHTQESTQVGTSQVEDSRFMST